LYWEVRLERSTRKFIIAFEIVIGHNGFAVTSIDEAERRKSIVLFDLTAKPLKLPKARMSEYRVAVLRP